MGLWADIGVWLIPAVESFLCPPRDLVHQFWGELDQLAALRLFERFLEQRTQVLQLCALPLFKSEESRMRS